MGIVLRRSTALADASTSRCGSIVPVVLFWTIAGAVGYAAGGPIFLAMLLIPVIPPV